MATRDRYLPPMEKIKPKDRYLPTEGDKVVPELLEPEVLTPTIVSREFHDLESRVLTLINEPPPKTFIGVTLKRWSMWKERKLLETKDRLEAIRDQLNARLADRGTAAEEYAEETRLQFQKLYTEMKMLEGQLQIFQAEMRAFIAEAQKRERLAREDLDAEPYAQPDSDEED